MNKKNTWLQNNSHECTVLLKYDGSFPLDKGSSIALFGNGARHTIKGGTGSGDVNVDFLISCEEGLLNAGFKITSTKWLDEYDQVKEKQRMDFISGIFKRANELNIPPILAGFGKVEKETDYNLQMNYDADAAIYVLSRISGEGSDTTLTRGDSLLTDTEVNDILTLNKKFNKFILVLNTGRYIDLSPVLEVKNILLLGQLGSVTGSVLGNIILGKKNPSGRLCETWGYSKDYGVFPFGDLNETKYKEGIYVGYRYFKTAEVDTLFPFGFGLSFTRFSHKFLSVSHKMSNITLNFEVKNIGNFKGKYVLQVYISCPGDLIDRPKYELVGFKKTKELLPGETQKLKIMFNLADFAYFDEVSSQYKLEKGNYLLSFGENVDCLNEIFSIHLDENIVLISTGKGFFGKPTFEDLKIHGKINKSNKSLCSISLSNVDFIDRNYCKKKYRINPFVKTLSVDELIYMTLGEYTDGAGFSVVGSSNYHVAGAAGETTSRLKEKLNSRYLNMADGPAGLRLSKYFLENNDSQIAVYPNVPNEIKFFADEKTKESYKKAYEQIDKSLICERKNTALPVGSSIAQTWNLDYAKKCGELVGEEMVENKIDFWLAPAMNIKRVPFCGRNFEYFSEDPLISGLFASSIAKGVNKFKKFVTYKHFLCNNQEFNRYNNNSQVSERAIREIYLKTFEIAFKHFKPCAVMTSYNLINGVHTSENSYLLNDVLRGEFGFDGIVMTDWMVSGVKFFPNSIHDATYASKQRLAGNDLTMPGNFVDFNDIKCALQNKILSRSDLEICASRIYDIIEKKYK